MKCSSFDNGLWTLISDEYYFFGERGKSYEILPLKY